MSGVEDTSAAKIAAALGAVGERLKELRLQRGVTLTGVAESTGISKSTLSRLENGQRRPTLELLLALSHAYRVPLDDLVAAPRGRGSSAATQTGPSQRPNRDPTDPPARRDAGLEHHCPDNQRHP